MWKIKESNIEPNIRRYQIEVTENQLMSVAEVVEAWETDPGFCSFYAALLAASPFRAFFWELPPICLSDTDRPFEFVLVNSNALARVSPAGRAFQNHFKTGESVVVFQNLGRDATLVVPSPVGKRSAYPHLAQFVREGPEAQIREFWKVVGQTYREQLSHRPLWLSTSGLGVYWLHIRLDIYPKYYTYSPYRNY